jgi:DNA repair protein RAD57
LTLLLASQLQSTDDGGPSDAAPGSALYISTEAPLQTTRLAQILKQHPKLAALPPERRPSLGRIHSTHVHDVVAQDHILHFQVPVAIAKHNINLVIVDSIAANYRAEFDKGGGPGGGPGARSQRGAETLAQRSQEIAQTAKSLRDIARKHNITVVVANQVADRFAPIEPSSQQQQQQQQQVMRTSSQRSLGRATTTTATADPPPAPAAAPPQLSTADPLSLEHQQRFFTGWGDDASSTDLKTPSLGLALTNQLSTRIALLKSPVYKDRAYRAGEDKELDRWDRSCRVVFSAWGAEGRVPFEIWEGGVRSLPLSSVGEGGGGGGGGGGEAGR